MRKGPGIAVIARSVSPLHPPGGLERHVEDLVRHLLARGLAITLITRPPVSRAALAHPAGHASSDEHWTWQNPRLSIHYVPYRTFPFAGRRWTTVLDRSTAYPLFGWRAGRVAAGLAREGAIDLVHGLGASALGYAVARRRHAGTTVPFIFNPQGLEEFGATDPRRAGLKRLGYRPLQAAVRLCARAADRVIATDRALEPVLLQHLPVSASKVRVVPNAVDLEHCDRMAGPPQAEALRRRHALRADDVVLLSVGRIEENKGFFILARALARLRAEAAGTSSPRPGWRWVIGGDGPMRPRLEREVQALGLGAASLFLGRPDEAELHAWYEAATLFVHPTLYEGSSLVTLEAMAHRRAVIATRAGGLPDKVQPGVTGWLVPPGDETALAAALAEAMEHRARLPAMGHAGRAAVEHEFAWPAVVERLLAVYREVGVAV
jgi:glycogen synthase